MMPQRKDVNQSSETSVLEYLRLGSTLQATCYKLQATGSRLADGC